MPVKKRTLIIIISSAIIVFLFSAVIISFGLYYSNAITLINGIVKDAMYNEHEAEYYNKWISPENLEIIDFFPDEYANKNYSVSSDLSFCFLKKISLKKITVNKKMNIYFLFTDGTEYSYKNTFTITVEYNGEYWVVTDVKDNAEYEH